jgi:hypothetical protein
VTTTKKQPVITCNLNEIDTEPRLDDRWLNSMATAA